MVGSRAGRERRATARRAEDASLRRILNATADGIVVVDRAGTVCYANPAAEALFGRTAGELNGRMLGFPLVAGATTEVDVLGRAGETVVEMRTVEIDWEGEPAYLASLRDVTERRRAEEDRTERIRAEAARAEAEAALRARDAFLAMAAHELKTPLTRLTLAVQTARRQTARSGGVGPRSAGQALGLVEREAAHLSRLVRQLLDVARVEAGAFELNRSATDLRRLVERAAAAARAAADGHPVEVRLPGNSVVALVDPDALEDVLTDLLTSAVRYTPAGTAIEAELGAAEPVADATAHLVVRDHGPPVPAEVRAAVTVPHLPPHDDSYVSGPAVALHVARRVVELHGGRIDVEFPDDGGTRVVLTVPLA